MHVLTYCAAACLFAATALAQELSWSELVRRPDLWPTQCSSKQEMKFDGGVTVRPGQKLAVLKVMATEAQVETLDARTAFTVEPNEVDLLAVAQAAYAKLTPKQRALNYEALVRQKELWPLQVTLKKTFDMGGGKTVREGEQFGLVNLLPDRLVLKSESLKATFQVVPQATDIMTLGRALAEDTKSVARFVDAPKEPATRPGAVAASAGGAEPKKAPFGPVIAELELELISSVTGKPAPLDENLLPKYIVLFRGSSTCPITRQFAPTLIKYYQEMRPSHPEFEIVYLMTETPENTSKFAKELGFSWRAIRYNHGYMPTVMQPIGSLLPQLVVLDRSGRVLANGIQNSAPNALKQLDALLKSQR